VLPYKGAAIGARRAEGESAWPIRRQYRWSDWRLYHAHGMVSVCRRFPSVGSAPPSEWGGVVRDPSEGTAGHPWSLPGGLL